MTSVVTTNRVSEQSRGSKIARLPQQSTQSFPSSPSSQIKPKHEKKNVGKKTSNPSNSMFADNVGEEPKSCWEREPEQPLGSDARDSVPSSPPAPVRYVLNI